MRLEGLPGDTLLDVRRRLNAIHAYPGVKKVYVFGSYAKGTATGESDIDVAAFIDTQDDHLLRPYRDLAHICLNADVEIQVQVFRLSELSEPCGIVEEIVSFGYEYDPESA